MKPPSAGSASIPASNGPRQRELLLPSPAPLSQARVQYRFARRLDMASEFRWVVQPVSKSRRAGYGAELGFWALSDLRLAAGYNFNGAREARNNNPLPARGGIYFSISSKLSNLFDLFGTAKSSGSGNSPQTSP